MSLPRGDEYQAAVQNPRTAFSDPELRACSVDRNPLGLPVAYAGGFTTTYRLRDSRRSKSWACRCFKVEIPELQRRYEAIGRFLSNNPTEIFVEATHLPRGIWVGGGWFPVIKMQWVDGEPLNSFIDKNIAKPNVLRPLAAEFLRVTRELQRLGAAHGDLQHGNIIVKNGKMYLIDYDGLIIPELHNLNTNNIGHINYQSPLRTSPRATLNIDSFSSIVIYLGLSAIAYAPQLWKKYDNSENILFCRDDFVDADSSPLVSELRAIPELSRLAVNFAAISRMDIDVIPTLDEFISGDLKPRQAPSHALPTCLRPTQYLVIEGTNKQLLLQHIGDRVEVVGQITDSRFAFAINRQPYVFLNFGRYPNQTFTLVLWSEALRAFREAGTDPTALKGKWISVTGVIGSYRGRPQVAVEGPSQIHVLGGPDEAQRRIRQKPLSVLDPYAGDLPSTTHSEPNDATSRAPVRGQRVFRPSAPLSAPRKRAEPLQPANTAEPIGRQEADVLNRLYGAGRQSSPSKPSQSLPSESQSASDGVSTWLTTVAVVALASVILCIACSVIGHAGSKTTDVSTPVPRGQTDFSYSLPKSTAMPAIVSQPTSTPLNDVWPIYAFTQVPQTRMRVCSDLAYAYSRPDQNSKTVFQMSGSDGASVYVTGKLDQWYIVQHAGAVAFMRTESLCLTSPSATPTSQRTASTQTPVEGIYFDYVLTDSLSLSGDVTQPLIAVFDKGATINIRAMGHTTLAGGHTRVRIRLRAYSEALGENILLSQAKVRSYDQNDERGVPKIVGTIKMDWPIVDIVQDGSLATVAIEGWVNDTSISLQD